MRKIAQIFVAFSEKLNFMKMPRNRNPLTGTFFETGAYGVQSKSPSQTVWGQDSQFVPSFKNNVF